LQARWGDAAIGRRLDREHLVAGGLPGDSGSLGLRRQQGAVRQFTKTVAIDCARKGYKVRCNSVHPGVIPTPMGNAVMPNDKARERARRRIPIGDFGAPEDIAYGILYLISDESRFVTGTELVIDGGMNAI
jgi:3(or 17)beta-hydroxysteroid dehydrogenase